MHVGVKIQFHSFVDSAFGGGLFYALVAVPLRKTTPPKLK